MKGIRLSSPKLHKIISESIHKIIREGKGTPHTIDMCIKLGIDPNEIAKLLFNNGIDAYQFTHEVEDAYEMLQSEEQSQSSSPRMALIQAIKKSRYFNDTSDQGFGYVGDAPLIKPIFGNKKIDEIGYSINQGNIEFYGFSTEIGEWYDDIKINDEQIPQIISLIK